MRVTKRILGFALVLALALTLVGVAAPVRAQAPTTIVFGWEQEPQLLTPRQDMTFGSLLTNFYARGLWDFDGDRLPFPVMVEEVPSTDNGLVRTLDNGNTEVTIRLREGILWSDGVPITSEDIVFSHELTMNPSTVTMQRSTYPDKVESLVAVDERTVVMTYNSPFPDFQSSNLPGGPYIFPKHVFEGMLNETGNIDNHPMWTGNNVVGYGPYVFESWSVGQEIVFTANPYWDGQQPGFERAIIRFITDTTQMVNALRAGEIDVAFNFPDPQVADYEAIDGVEVFNTPGVYGDALWMNLRPDKTHPALLERAVREAIIHGIDRATLAEQLVGPGVQLARSWFPDQFLPEDMPFLEYNPDLARQMLDEAGWVDTNDNGIRDKDGVELILRFYTTTRQVRMDYQVAIQSQLNEIGVSLQLFPVPATILFADFAERGILDTGDFDLALFALSSDPLSPAANAPDWFGCGGIPTPDNPNGNNGWGFCDPEFDRLDLLVLETVDVAQRMELAQEMYRRFFDGAFWHGLYLRPTWYAINAMHVDGEAPRGVGTLSSNYFNNIEYWRPAGGM
jgi:peptide/nickel transport system substrate-binding protein